jgi:hypothetical protein
MSSSMTRRLPPRRARVRLLSLLVCLLGVACQQQHLAQDDTPLGQCQRQAEQDPKVKALIMETFNGVNGDPAHFQQLKVARYEATNACLRARGIPVPGGVEPVQKPVYLF